MLFVADQTLIEDLEALRQVAVDRSINQWVYVGEDSAWRIRVEEALGSQVHRWSIADVLGDVSWKLRQPYIDWIGELSQSNDSLEWWASSLAEKNPFDQLYLRICLLASVMELIKRGLDSGTMIICSSQVLLDQVARFAAANDTPVELLPVPKRRHALRDAARRGRSRLRVPYQAARRAAMRLGGAMPPALDMDPATRRTVLSRRGVSRGGDFSGDESILVFTFADRRNVAPDGSYRDPYLGGLPEELRKRGYSVAYVPRVLPSARFEETIEGLLRTGERFFFRELFVSPKEVPTFRERAERYRPALQPNSQVGDVPVHDLALEQLEQGRERLAEALLYERLVASLADAGVRPRRVIHPWHGQSWEQALAWSIRRHMPEASIVGYDVGTFSRMYLSTFPARNELGRRPLPYRVVTSGVMARDMLTCDGLPADMVRAGCSLRFPELAAEPDDRDHHSGNMGKCPVIILVAPSIGFGDSIDLIVKAIHAFGGSRDIELVVKIHPLVPVEGVVRGIGNLSRHVNVRFSDEPPVELLSSAQILLYTHTTVCFDALGQGVMPVFVRSENDLHMDKLGSAPEVRKTATTPDDLRRVVAEIVGMSLSDWKRWQGSARDALRRAFAPVTSERVDEFIV